MSLWTREFEAEPLQPEGWRPSTAEAALPFLNAYSTVSEAQSFSTGLGGRIEYQWSVIFCSNYISTDLISNYLRFIYIVILSQNKFEMVSQICKHHLIIVIMPLKYVKSIT